MAKKKSATDGADEFEASGPATPAPSPAEITADPATWVPKEAKSEPKPKFDPTAGQKPIYPTADEMRDTFAAQTKAAGEHQLRQLALAHPEVAALIAERDALKAKLEK